MGLFHFNPPDGQTATKLIHCLVSFISKSFGSFNKSLLGTYYVPATVHSHTCLPSGSISYLAINAVLRQCSISASSVANAQHLGTVDY
jgi:hypothetical protein